MNDYQLGLREQMNMELLTVYSPMANTYSATNVSHSTVGSGLGIPDWKINLAEEKDLRQRGFIIATKPLTNEEWISFHIEELMVFNGIIMYLNARFP